MKIISNNRRNTTVNNSFVGILRGGFCLYLRICLVIILLLPTLILTSSAPGSTVLDSTYLSNHAYTLSAGSYHLNGNLTLLNMITINSGAVEIDLNGFTIQYSSSAYSAFVITNNASLTLEDSLTGGAVSNNGACVYIDSGSFTLLSGNLSTSTTGKTCVHISSGSTMTMSGGVVSSLTSPCIVNEGTLNKSGGTLLVGGSEVNLNDIGGVVNDITPEPEPDGGKIEIGASTDYPSVSYDISFPVIAKLSLLRNETEDIDETPFEITINRAQYLFDEREILISFSSDLQLKNTENDKTLPYVLVIGGQSCTNPSSPINLIIDNQAIDTFAGKIVIDQQDIPAKGEYQAEIVYIITVQDK